MCFSRIRGEVRRVTFRSVARAIGLFSALSCRRKAFLKGPRTQKALIVGINYTKAPGSQGKLFQSNADALKAKRVLMEVFKFEEANIILLVDDEKGDDLPTYEGIVIKALETFVNKDETNVDYVFIYTGHASQSEAKDTAVREEVDGKSEFIMPVDSWSQWNPIRSKIIYDYVLRSHLVDRLGKGSKLLAIFDCCHSATLLNLKHNKCLRCGKCTSFARRLVRRVLCDPFQMSIVRTLVTDNLAQPATRVERLLRKIPYRISFTQSEGFCTGFCHTKQRVFKYPRVLCIAGCKDSQRTIENGPTMLHSLLQLLEKNQHPTFREIMDLTRSNVKEIRYTRVNARPDLQGKDAAAQDGRFLQAALSDLRARRLFPAGKAWNPEMSAEEPVDMNEKLFIT